MGSCRHLSAIDVVGVCYLKCGKGVDEFGELDIFVEVGYSES